MDDLRSLEGIGILLQKKEPKVKFKPQFNRANSVIPKKKKKVTLDVIKSLYVDFSTRSYSSRGGSVAEVAASLKISESNENENENENKNENENENKNQKDIIKKEECAPSNPLHSILSTENTDTNNNEDYGATDEFITLDNYDDSHDLVSDISLHAMGLGSIGLNLNEIENESNENAYDENDEWFNDIHLGITVEDEKQTQTQTQKQKQKQNDISQLDNINRFPMEEFINYPSSSSDNKENASNINIIGTGSFGIVIKSFHFHSCQTVAIKQCRISDDKKILSLFLQEAQLYKEFVDNKYIIDILGFGRNEENNKLCIALEYMDLQSISKINYKLDESQLKYICFCIISALNAMHEKKYIHNDLKPDNLLINSRGEVRLSDFGCCIKMNDNVELIYDNICGSKQYFAPEKWLISPPQYNMASDIWSFGITFYELITLTMQSNREFGFTEAPNTDELLTKYSKNLCLFLSKMVVYDFKQRWNAKQLLNHPFLLTANKIKSKPFLKTPLTKKKENDLQFMVDSLIKYYSNKHWFDHQSQKEYNDKEKISNLCKHSGCTIQEVNTMIKFAVSNVKRQINKAGKPANH